MPDQYVYFEGIEEAKKLFGLVVIDRAVSSAVNKIATKTRTAASRKIRETWNIKKTGGSTPAALVRKALDIRRSRANQKEAIILGRGKRLPLSAFGAKQKWSTRRGKRHRKGVVLRVRKTDPQKLVTKSIFMNTVRSGADHVMRRKGRARTPVDLLFGPSVPHMLGAKTTMEMVEKTVNDNLQKTMQHELEFYIAREIKKVV